MPSLVVACTIDRTFGLPAHLVDEQLHNGGLFFAGGGSDGHRSELDLSLEDYIHQQLFIGVTPNHLRTRDMMLSTKISTHGRSTRVRTGVKPPDGRTNEPRATNTQKLYSADTAQTWEQDPLKRLWTFGRPSAFNMLDVEVSMRPLKFCTPFLPPPPPPPDAMVVATFKQTW